MEVSDLTRAAIVAELSAEAKAQNEAAGHAEASRARIVRSSVERDEVGKASQRIVRKLSEIDGWRAHGKLRASISLSSREWFDEAIDTLIEAGRIQRRNTMPGHGEASYEYALLSVE
jgi:hypothetical protein